MIKSCNHSSSDTLCGTCREKNYREIYIEEEGKRISALEKALAASEQRVKALEEALTPSAETKIAFISEFSFRPSGYIANKYSDAMERVIVPWVTIKEIMNAIKQRAEATCQKK